MNTTNYLILGEFTYGGEIARKQTFRLKASQIGEVNKLLMKFEDENWKEYGEAIYEK